MSFQQYDFKFDPYIELEISYGAIDSEIKKAYRDLAKKYHPDRSGGSQERFQRISEAYEILSDVRLKTQFDAEREKKLWNSNAAPNYENEALFNGLKHAAQFVANQFFSDKQNSYTTDIPPIIEDNVDITTTRGSFGVSITVNIKRRSFKRIQKAIDSGEVSREDVAEYLGDVVADRFLSGL